MCLSEELCQLCSPLDIKMIQQRRTLIEFLNGYIEYRCPMGRISLHIPQLRGPKEDSQIYHHV